MNGRHLSAVTALALAAALAACGPSNDRPEPVDPVDPAAATAPVAPPSSASTTTAPSAPSTTAPATTANAPTPPPAPTTSAPTASAPAAPSAPTTSAPAAPTTTTPSAPPATAPTTSAPDPTTTTPSAPPATTTRPLAKPRVVWDPSPNKSSRHGTKIDAIVIHTTEGSYTSAVSWLRNPEAKVSAHYVIKEDGSEIRQLVQDDEAAWAQTYYNSRAIGIECAGFAHKASTWTPGLKATLTELVAWLAKTHGVRVEHPTTNAGFFVNRKLDLGGLIGHGQIQPWNRKDPGEYFDWDQFVKDVDARIAASR